MTTYRPGRLSAACISTATLVAAATVAFAQNAPPATVPQAAATQPTTAPVTQASTAPATTTTTSAFDEWLNAVTNPTPWFSWGGDVRVREEYQNNTLTLNGSAPGHEMNYQRLRVRLWGDIQINDDVSVYGRLAYEGFNWVQPSQVDLRPVWDSDIILVDNLYVQDKNFLVQNNKLTVGRQDITDLGDGWLIAEGTPLDGSRTSFFNAVRDVYDIKDAKTQVNLIYLNNPASPNDFISGINGQGGPDEQFLSEQNQQGTVLWVTNKSVEDTQLDGYFIWQNNQRVLPNGDDGNIYAFGGRVAHNFDDHWTMRAQGVYECGTRNNPALFGTQGDALSAFGATARLAYNFKDSCNDQLRITYEYLSGDDPNSSTNTQFDPLWGRWAQFSELWIWNAATENRFAEVTNLQRVAFGWAAEPNQKLELSADYHLLFANDNTNADLGEPGFSSSGLFRGQLFTTELGYKFDSHTTGALIGEYFIPGNYYSSNRQTPAVYFLAQLMYSF